ncbi:MAG: peroxiredoxin [Hyphomicrobium sp.]
MAVDWSVLPVPEDDGAAAHLPGMQVPTVALTATDGSWVDLSTRPGRTIVFAYPKTGQPGVPLPNGWDEIPGARGCTPQSCAFRDLHADLAAAGADAVFGLSTQASAEQQEAARRLHLPFLLLSDHALAFATALRLPVMEVDGRRKIRRLTLIIDDGRISHVFYPVFPPDRNAADVLAWIREHPR